MVRVALLALQNLLAAPGLDLAPEMVEAALPKVVQQRLLQVLCCSFFTSDTRGGFFLYKRPAVAHKCRSMSSRDMMCFSEVYFWGVAELGG